MGDGVVSCDRGCLGASGRSQTSGVAVPQEANEMAFKIDLMDSVACGFEAHALAPEGPANNAYAPMPADIATGGDLTGGPTPGVAQDPQWPAVGAAAFARQGSRRAWSQSFMRTLVIVVE